MKDINNRVSTLLRRFKSLFKRGIQDWTDAGGIIVILVDEYKLTTQEIADTCGNPFRVEHIDKFYRVGKGELLADLLAANWPVATKLAKLPRKVQEQAMTGIDVVLDGRKGSGVVRMTAPEMTYSTGKQVFDGRRIRSTAEQQAFIRAEREKAKRRDAAYKTGNAMYYKIVDGFVVIDRPCRLSHSDLIRMLADLEEARRTSSTRQVRSKVSI